MMTRMSPELMTTREGSVHRALPVYLRIAAIVGVFTTIIWLVTSDFGYFWPEWVWLAVSIPFGVYYAGRWVAQHPKRDRGYLIHVAVFALNSILLVFVWLFSGANDSFWPIYPILAVGASVAVHRAVRGRPQPELVERVDELTRTRRGALDVQTAQLRQIERDLHDGAQARLVALSMKLGRAEERLRDRPETAELLREAREEASAAIAELRDLARGIAPPVLADRGLAAAVGALAQRAPMAVDVETNLGERRPPTVVETAAYFVVAETLTNVAKHAPGAPARVYLGQTDTDLLVQVQDDGPGGADPKGGGLTGLRQRVEALDGELTIDSQPTGTTVWARFPCA